MPMQDDFPGAKLALFIGPRLLVYLRDARDDIPFPSEWDIPGGGREAGETPEDTALRETEEEFGLRLMPSDLVAKRAYPAVIEEGTSWFFAAHLPAEAEADIRFGDEGQHWALMVPEVFCALPEGVAHLRGLVREYLGQEKRVECRTPAPGRDGAVRIAKWKFDLLRGAILAVIEDAGAVFWAELDGLVAARMREEELAQMGSLKWYLVTVKLEMEVRGEIERVPGRGRQQLRRAG
jgi:8-oxo-dGTP diphosphatase